MKKLVKPQRSVGDVLEILKADNTSASAVLDIDCATQILIEREALYEVKVADNTLYEIPREHEISPRVDRGKMITYYEYRMRKKPMGRQVYEEILLSAPHDICPFCTVNTVKTVDHFLPKSQYPSYAVSPVNLVPSCTDCNIEKKISFPTNKDDQTFHPYFDTVDNEIWIKAILKPTNPLCFDYEVVKIESWDDNKFNRAKAHFLAYNVNPLFSTQANRELRGMQVRFKNLFSRDRELLRAHLEETYISCRQILGILDWKTVMYYELSTNGWFLNGCPGNSYFR